MLGQARAEPPLPVWGWAAGTLLCCTTGRNCTGQELRTLSRQHTSVCDFPYPHCTVPGAASQPGASQVQPMSKCFWGIVAKPGSKIQISAAC